MVGGGYSHREAAKDFRVLIWNVERLVLDLCVNGHCDLDGVVGWTVCESHWSDVQ